MNYKDDKKVRKFKKILLINIWPTYDQIDLRKSVVSRRPSVVLILLLHTYQSIYYLGENVVFESYVKKISNDQSISKAAP
jgi:hypothetical protein